MRFVAILICLGVLIGAAWHAVMRGTDQQMMLGAPQIQKIVDDAVRSAVLPLASHPIEIETDGRNTRLSGPVNSEAERQQIIAATQDIRFLADLDDDLRVLPQADPFLFQAVKSKDGSIVLSGHVPSEQIHEDLIAQAREQSEIAGVSDRLVLSAGAPEGDWAGMTRTGMTSLMELKTGQVQIAGAQAVISGTAINEAAAQRLSEIVNAAPMGDWQMQIAGALPSVEAYAFSAMKMEDGSVILDGNAPDDDAREALLEAAAAISAKPVAGTLALADGMPSPQWPDTMKEGIAALNLTANGLLKATGDAVSVTAEVETDDDLARLLPMLRDEWTTDITVRNPTPVARLEIALSEDGTLIARGLLPAGLEGEVILESLPGIDLSGIDPEARGRPADWQAPLEGLEIVLPRFETATAVLSERSVSVAGMLKRGFSADGAEAALKSALDRGWALQLDLLESAPLAELILSLQEGDLSISGVLPFGLDAADALTLLGDRASGEGLSGGGDGDPLAWSSTLEVTKLALAWFADSTGRVSDGQLELTGRLMPGYTGVAMQEWVSERLPEGWNVSLSAEEMPPSEGDQRISLKTGEAQNFRQGFWLPDVHFVVSPEQCRTQMDALLERENIVFVTGSARIDQQGRTLLNRLAAVAVRCLNSSVMTLEIGGHTDSVGNDENNLQLSQERADAVMQALLSRGVRVDAIQAVGYGEAEPVATNDTAEGRAQNRRIAFGWSERAN